MQKPNNALLLVGSPRGANSSSNSLGTFLLGKLQNKGIATKTVYLSQSLNSDKGQSAMLELVDQSDLIILAFPLYVDSLQSKMIEALELIAQNQKGKSSQTKKKLTAIVNSGFPEVNHNQTALAVCRLFA